MLARICTHGNAHRIVVWISYDRFHCEIQTTSDALKSNIQKRNHSFLVKIRSAIYIFPDPQTTNHVGRRESIRIAKYAACFCFRMEIELIESIIHYSLYSVGLLLNLLLIWLIACCTPRYLRYYSVLVFDFAIADLLITVTELFTITT